VEPGLQNGEIYAVGEVDAAVFFGDPRRPGAREHGPQSFWLADAGRALVWSGNNLPWILRENETHHNQHRPHRSLDPAAPLEPLPEPVDLDQHLVRRHPRVGGMINEYRLAA
jgi:hypothetical protein